MRIEWRYVAKCVPEPEVCDGHFGHSFTVKPDGPVVEPVGLGRLRQSLMTIIQIIYLGQIFVVSNKDDVLEQRKCISPVQSTEILTV